MKDLRTSAINMIVNYIATDPLNKMNKIVSLAERLDRQDKYIGMIKEIRDALASEDSHWRLFVENLFNNVNTKMIRKIAEGFVVNSTLVGGPRREKAKNRYQTSIPWAILMDPTSACNMSCTGCWAAQYGKQHNLSFETLDSICRQGKKLGIFWYIFSGGEPLIRKNDLIKLCEKHQDCFFLAFTNGTLVDEKFCEDLERVGNFTLAFSIEGDEETTDMRRGKGSYRKVINAMDLMHKHRIFFGYSTCYHHYNIESVASDEFVDDMIARGAFFAWNFTYMPVGKDADTDLLVTPEQRAYMYQRVREIRMAKPILALDFWNDGEIANGCIAGGRSYFHINALGDVEPCAFVHYSNVNIKEVSLIEALQSPIFKAYQKRQPFNDNMLRPCPVLDNPEIIKAIIEESHAKSTDMLAPEPVEQLCAKTIPAAEKWALKADELWNERLEEIKRKEAYENIISAQR
ncbi:MAG: radical SAM protein [Candidatus Cloacimonadaceae bacterium]